MMQKTDKKFSLRFLSALVTACMLFTCATVFSGVSAAGDTEYFYVNSETGDDGANGRSAAAAVKTFTRACNLARKEGGTIVITNAYEMPKTVYEVEHEDAPFVITTKDATTDYGASGAKLIFGKALRYVMKGDTTFENITIEFANTLNVVANYNHITFGDGFTTTNIGSGSEGVYVVGGYQSPEDTVDASLDSHITIRSGKFHIVAGGSRQKGSGAAGGIVYTGTHYIEVSGGEITRLYGGSIQHQIATNTNITVTGGEIHDLYTAGDLTRRLEGNATLSLTGGKIGSLSINNVVGGADVTLAGTEIETASVAYANDTIAKMATKANKAKTLYYDAHFYTAEQIAAYADGFTKAENITSIYAKEGATGGGLSAADPASFENAIKIAAETQGNVLVLGTVNVKDLTETAHAAKIVVKGGDSGARLNVTGTYTLGGETVFESLTVAADKATFNADKGLLTIAEDVKLSGKPDVVGSATLYAGAFGTIKGGAADMRLIVGGAEVDSIVGGTTAAKIEINGGKVGAVKSTETAIASFELAVNDGTVGSVTFKDVTDKLSYLLYGGKVGTYAVEGSNAKGTLSLDESRFKTLDLGAAAALFTVSADKVYYLSDSGKGNGTSFSAAGNSMVEAYKTLAGGGTLVVCGTYTIKDAFINQYNTGKITITSVYGGVDYRATNDAKLVFKANFYCGGETEFNNISLLNQKSYGGIYANINKLVIGAGVECSYAASVTTTYPSIQGGTNLDIELTEAEKQQTSDVTISSGTWQRVRGGSATGGHNSFNVRMTINGGEFREKLVLVSANSHIGSADVTINGGTFLGGIYGSTIDKAEQIVDGNIKLTFNGGTPYGTIAASLNNIGTLKGSFDVVLNGGNFGHITDIIGTEGVDGWTMTSSLHAGDGVSLDANVTGTMSFQNPVRSNGADPWLFFHDGNYYYIATHGSRLDLYKAANIGDLPNASYKTIYKPEEGKAWSKNLWSPEIHHYTDEEVGAGNGGWYCYIACDDGANTNHRMYVIKCLDGDNLLGRWGNPVTGEVNVPQRIEAKDIPGFDDTWAAGQTDIKINGQLYMMYVTEGGRDTADFYQTINIIKMTNPWTLVGQSSVICKPDYEWEMGGAAYNPTTGKAYPKVVEGGTAVYGSDGSIFIVYSGSGYWTTEYKLGQMKYLGGDPLLMSSWEKLPTPILSKSDKINGCGHASYVTDTDGQGWICYHAYKGRDTQGGRFAYVEPYTATKDGVVIGSGTKHPADPDTVYTVNLNTTPIREKIHAFGKVDQAESKFSFTRDYKDNFTDVPANAWFYTYVRDAYRVGLANGTSATKFSPDMTFTVAQALTAAANIHTIYTGNKIDTAGAKTWYDPYVNYCIANGIIKADQFKDYNANITRGDMAIVFANILPAEEYAAVRTGSNPDVTSDLACYAAVQKLYNAGIVGGDAGTGNYRPNDSIKRSEACVIFTRIALKSARAK